VRHVPDSEGEEDREPINENGRGKSPFEQVLDMTKRALAPATFYLRQRSQEPEAHATNGKDPSYDYSAEEREFQAAQNQRFSTSRKVSATHKRNRLSTDNKAYRPSMSDLETDDDNIDDDGKKVRRRKKKKDLPGGPLTTLPVAGYDKKKKKKPRTSKGNTAEAEADDGSGSDDHASEQVSGLLPYRLTWHLCLVAVIGLPRICAPPFACIYTSQFRPTTSAWARR
jgi:SUN domain-containing protein 1/2